MASPVILRGERRPVGARSLAARARRLRPPPTPAAGRLAARAAYVLAAALLFSGCITINLPGALPDPLVEEVVYGDSGPKVLLVQIEGVLRETPEATSLLGFAEESMLARLREELDRARDDQRIRALLLRINSPGGTVTASDILYDEIRRFKQERGIPVVAQLMGVAASGGYYVALAADEIVAHPTTVTGSIGVIIPHYNATELLGEIGVEEDSVVSHPLKGMGSFSKPMSDEEREIFQELVDDSFKRFKEIIRSGRTKFEKDPKALDKLATGQIYTADQAIENGLVDRIGFIEEAIDRAITLASLPRDEVRVVKYKREPTLADFLIGVKAQGARDFDLTTLLDMTVPRAYFFCTRLPPLVRSGSQ